MKYTSTALKNLGVKGGAQKVFEYLVQNGISPVTKIAEAINTPKSSIYDSLSELSQHGLIIEYRENRSKEYGAISKDQLKDVISNKIKNIKSSEESLLSFMNSIPEKMGSVKPKIKFYVGLEGIRQAFRDTTWNNRCKETFLMWPTKDMIDILTPEFSKWHSEQRLKFNVMMYIIRKHSDRKMDKDSIPLLESSGWKTDREIKYAPKKEDWNMSYWIYDDKCLFASSSGEHFAFVVHSKEFAQMMTLLWRQMWNASEK